MKIHSEESIIALAGVIQSATLVNNIARGRWADPDMFNSTIQSIFVEHPKNALDVFGNNIQNLNMGLRKLSTFFPKPDRRIDGDIARYLFGCILLARSLRKDNARLNTLDQDMSKLSSMIISPASEELLAALAKVYMRNFSNQKHRIHIIGSEVVLKQEIPLNHIRALLLAGVRSSILWYQVGGRLWHLWLQRNQIAELAKSLLK